MKDSQPAALVGACAVKYIKESNERFSTYPVPGGFPGLSISRRVMKDSQPLIRRLFRRYKYIKESNERFSTYDKPGDRRA